MYAKLLEVAPQQPYQAPEAPGAYFETWLAKAEHQAVEADSARYDSAAASRKLSAAMKRLKSQLNQLEHAGGLQLVDEWRRKITEQLDACNRDLAGDIESSKQGRAAAMAAQRAAARRAKADRVPAALTRTWVETETAPDADGRPSQELYDLFVAWCERQRIGANKIPSMHSWGRVLTDLAYPSVQKRYAGTNQKWRPLRPRSDG